jgi:hypothetical protein
MSMRHPRLPGSARSFAAASALALLAGSPGALADNYLLLVADSATVTTALRNSLVAAGLTNVDVYPFASTLPTPTLGELLGYDAVLTYTNLSYADGAAMGNVLADYVDAGGGVVCAVFCVSSTTANRSLTGRWQSGGYDIIPQRSGTVSTATTLGTVVDPAHPLWAGMTTFTGGTGTSAFSRSITTTAAAHAVRVADWASGQVLVAGSSLYPSRVDLNVYPTAWHATPDGVRLLVNALTYAAAQGSPTPGGCCTPDGACQVLSPSACFAAGGVFRGGGTDCASPCPQPAACCFPDGSCSVILETACIAGGGIFNSSAATCAAANCPQPPTGGCCLPDQTCLVVWQGGCIAQGGVYGGDNTTCATANCLNLVVPNANANVEGASSNSFPFTATAAYFHYQQVYAASDFAALSGPHRITGVQFRPNATSTAPVWSNTFDLNLRLSTTPALPDALSATFTDNIGADEAVVYSGPVTISTQQVTPISPGPAHFDVNITFQTPFVYDPALGNLLINLERNGGDIGTNRFLDAVSPTGDPVGRVTTSTVGATTGTVSSIGLVTRFLLEPAGPAPCYANCDGSTIAPVLNVLDFNCFLNRFAAGDSYANCDGSTIAPVLNVLDFNCFLNRFAAGCP